MRLIPMDAVQAIPQDFLSRSRRFELVPCNQELGGEQKLAAALANLGGVVNQGEQLAMLLLYSKARGVVFGFVFQDQINVSALDTAATIRKQEAMR